MIEIFSRGPFGKSQLLMDEEVFEEHLFNEHATKSNEQREVSVAGCIRSIEDGILSEDVVRQIYGSEIFKVASTEIIREATFPSLEQRAEQIIAKAAASLSRREVENSESALHAFLEKTVSLFRLTYSSFLFLIIVSQFLHASQLALQDPFINFIISLVGSVMFGTVFYYFYFFFIHKYVIRNLTDRVFGSSIYISARQILRNNGIDDRAVDLQDVISKFLHLYKLRTNGVIVRNSLFHIFYMTLLVGGAYLGAIALAYAQILKVGFVLAAFLFCVGIVMRFDSRYAERDEAQAIDKNAPLFVGYVKSHSHMEKV